MKSSDTINNSDILTEILNEIYLESIDKRYDEEFRIVIAGAGVAGIFSALEILKKFPQAIVKIVEQKEKILSGTSANTPGRMGLGYHYKDFETALNYMKNTLSFMKKYNDCFIEDEEMPNLVNGRYFILKSSIVNPQDLISTYDRLSLEFEKLWMADPEIQKLFPGTCHLHRSIPRSEYSQYVDPEIVHLAIETREKLLDWNKFEKKVLAQLSEFIDAHRAEILTSTEVIGVSYNKDSTFEIELQKKTDQGKSKFLLQASSFVNATWQNTEKIDKKFNITSYLDWIVRMKFLSEVKIPKSLSDAHSMFFCLGPFAMFSNMGVKKDSNGNPQDYSYGRITYAEVTNHSYYSSTEMPDLYRRILEGELMEEDIKLLNESGKKIIDGVAKYIPKMAEAELIRVLPGIIKSVGDVNIFDPNSKFHERREDGVEELLLDYNKNAAIKLFFCLMNAEKLFEIMQRSIVTKIVINNLLKKISENIFLDEQQKENVTNFLRIYIKRYLFDQINKFSISLIDHIKKENLFNHEIKESSLYEQKEILDNFFKDIFARDNSFDSKLKLSEVGRIAKEKNHLKKLYNDLLSSLDIRNKLLKQIKDSYDPHKSEQKAEEFKTVKEKSIKEIYVESGYLDYRARIIEDGNKRKDIKSLNYLFDLSDNSKDLEKFKASFDNLVTKFSSNLQSYQIELDQDVSDYQESLRHDILKFYNLKNLSEEILKFYEIFLLKKLPQISFEYEKSDEEKIDIDDNKLTKHILDKGLCIDLLEWILSIENNNVKKHFLEHYELFLKNFATTIERLEVDDDRGDGIAGYIDFCKEDNKKIIQSIKTLIDNQDINIRQFVNLVCFKVNNYIIDLTLMTRVEKSEDLVENKKIDFISFKVQKYQQMLKLKAIDNEKFVGLKNFSFDDYLKISSFEEPYQEKGLKVKEKLHLEISCKLYELVFEKKNIQEMLIFLKSLDINHDKEENEDIFQMDMDDSKSKDVSVPNLYFQSIIKNYDKLDDDSLFDIVSLAIKDVSEAFNLMCSSGLYKSDQIDSEDETISRASSSVGSSNGSLKSDDFDTNGHSPSSLFKFQSDNSDSGIPSSSASPNFFTLLNQADKNQLQK